MRAMFNVEWRNPVDGLDVDSDGAISPLDPLVIINEINARGSRPLSATKPADADFVDVRGDGTIDPLDVLTVVNHINANGSGVRTLVPRGAFERSQSVPITVGNVGTGSRGYSIDLIVQLDPTTKTRILPDLLSVYLVEPDSGANTLLDRGVSGTSLFSLDANGKVELATGLVEWDGRSLQIDLSGVTNRDTAELRFQLLTGSSISSSRVQLLPSSNTFDANRVQGQLVPDRSSVVASGAGVNLSDLTQTTVLTPDLVNSRFDGLTGKFTGEFELKYLEEITGLPSADSLTEGTALEWEAFADGATASVSNSADFVRSGAYSIKLDTLGGFDTGIRYRVPSGQWDLSDIDAVTFWVYGNNTTPISWQGNQPIIKLLSPEGSLTLTPNQQMMPNFQWAQLTIPLSGDSTWEPEISGDFSLANVTIFEIHQDTWDYGFVSYYDGFQFIDQDPQVLGRTAVMVFPGLPAEVTILNPSGVDPQGHPYINASPAIRNGGLGQSESSDRVIVEISNPRSIPFQLEPQIWVGAPNRAPSLPPIANQTVMPGSHREVNLVASDADGDVVSFSISKRDGGLLPGVSLDSARNTLIIEPSPGNLGQHVIEVTATDGTASATQSFTLNVVPDSVTTTRIRGQLVEPVRDSQGNESLNIIAGMRVEIGNLQAFTDANGRFDIDLGSQSLSVDTLRVRGDLFPGSVRYPYLGEKLPEIFGHAIYLGYRNEIRRPIYVPRLDTASGSIITPSATTTVTGANGASITVPPGSLTNPQGTPFNGLLSITEVPPERTPISLPDGLRPDVVVTIQPADLRFVARRPITLPNRANYPIGTILDLWSINPNTGLFEDSGDMRVVAAPITGNPSRTILETLPGGGVLFSSWHFAARPRPTPIANDDRNLDEACPSCVETDGNFVVETHSGATQVRHALAPVFSMGSANGLTLHYDSMRADPRPIVSFGYENLFGNSSQRMVASLSLRKGDTVINVPGYSGGMPGTVGGEHFWKISESGTGRGAIQADLTDASTGIYEYTLKSGPMQYDGRQLAGTLATQTGPVVVVNSISSPFGAGWGLVGLKKIFEQNDGSLLIVDGDGGQLVFKRPTSPNSPYLNPPGDFSTLTKATDGTFRHRSIDGTVSLFRIDGQLSSITDRVGNTWNYYYDANGILAIIEDPTLRLITFRSVNGRIVEIRDQANRSTKLSYDLFGNLIGIEDPDTSKKNYGYDSDHRLISETNKNGQIERLTYDLAGRAKTAIRADGTTLNYDPIQSQLIQPVSLTTSPQKAPSLRYPRATTSRFVDANGIGRTKTIDKLGQVVDSQDIFGSLGETKRNPLNQVVETVSGKGDWTKYEYNGAGRTTSITDRVPGMQQFALVHNLNRLYRMDLQSSSTQFISNVDTQIFDIAYHPNHGSFVVDSAGRIRLIDLNFGLTTTLSTTNSSLNGLAFRSDGTLFASGNALYTINLATGQATRVGNSNFSGFISSGDIAFDNTGNLFLAAHSAGATASRLVRLNTADGTATYIGTGIGNFGFVLGLTYVDGLGMLGYTERGEVIRIDLSTGVGTLFRNLGSTISVIGGATLYDAPGLKLSTTRMEYDPFFQQLTRVVDPLGNQTIYTIDPNNGNRLNERRVIGNVDSTANGETDDLVTQYTYTTFGLLDTVTDPRGFVTDFDYDYLGRRIKATYAKGTSDELSETFTYDLVGNLTSSTDGRANVSLLEYDTLNRLTKTTAPDPDDSGPLPPSVTTFDYDAFGNMLKMTDSRGNVTTSVYDVLNRAVRITTSDPDGSGPASASTVSYTYDRNGNRLSQRDANGNTTSYVYDQRQRLISQRNPDGGITRFGYDKENNTTSVTDPVGNVTQFAYDSRNRLVSETQVVNGFGQGMGFLSRKIQLSIRNEFGKPITQDGPAATVSENGLEFSVPAQPTIIGVNIDVNRNSMDFEITDTRTGSFSSSSFNGYLLSDSENKIPDIIGVTVDTSVNTLGLSSSRIFWDRDRIAVNVSGLSFSRGRKAKLLVQFAPEEQTRTYRYDENDRLVETRDRNGRTTQFSYDAVDRVISEQWKNVDGSQANLIEYGYDKASNLGYVEDAFGSVDYTYDPLNRPETAVNVGLPGVPGVEFTYSYDRASNITSVTDSISGSLAGTTSYNYDRQNRVTSIAQTGNGVNPKVVDLVYNELGQFSRIDRYGDSQRATLATRTQFSYDGRNRLASLTHGSATNARSLAFYDYQYDAADRITAITDIDGRTEYRYDVTNQLTGATRGSTDSRGNESYTYDRNGNRTSSHLATSYTTGAQNRLASDGTYTYSYDFEGNMSRRVKIATGETRDFTWDHRNRLIRVTDKSSGGIIINEAFYTYDALNRRIARTIDTDGAGPQSPVTEHYLYDGDHVALEFRDADGPGSAQQPILAVRNLFGPRIDMILAQEYEQGNQTRWLLTDHLGTVRDIITGPTAVLNHIRYDSFGNILSQSTPSAASRYAFTGREWDASINTYYYRARFYDALLGRFISEDPIGFLAGDANLLRYVGNKSTSHLDPFGMDDYSPGSFTEDLIKEGIQNGPSVIPGGIIIAGKVVAQWSGNEQIRENLETIDYVQTCGSAIISCALHMPKAPLPWMQAVAASPCLVMSLSCAYDTIKNHCGPEDEANYNQDTQATDAELDALEGLISRLERINEQSRKIHGQLMDNNRQLDRMNNQRRGFLQRLQARSFRN